MQTPLLVGLLIGLQVIRTRCPSLNKHSENELDTSTNGRTLSACPSAIGEATRGVIQNPENAAARKFERASGPLCFLSLNIDLFSALGSTLPASLILRRHSERIHGACTRPLISVPQWQAFQLGILAKFHHWGLDEAERAYTLRERKTSRSLNSF